MKTVSALEMLGLGLGVYIYCSRCFIQYHIYRRVMDTSFDLMSSLDTLSVADLQPTPPPTPVDEEPLSIMAALSVAANFDITDQKDKLPTVSLTPQEDCLRGNLSGATVFFDLPSTWVYPES